MLWSLSSYISSNISSVVLFLLFLRYLITLNRNKRLPKGPSGLPLIGYLPWLGKNPQKTLCKLGETYGSIYTLPLGEQHIVILNDWDSVRNALRKDSFLGRPDLTLFSLVTGVKSLIDEIDSSNWREDRRFFESSFRLSFENSTIIYNNLINELKSLVYYLKKTNGKTIEIRKNTKKYISNFFYSFIFGKHYVSNKSLFDSALFLKISILSLYPFWLAKAFYKLLDVFNHYHFALFAKFFRSETKNHFRSMRQETSIRDLIDYYIFDMQTKKNNLTATTMSIDKLRANCQVFLSFGNEAFLSSFEWSLISVACFSEYQTIIVQEINDVIGNNRLPDFKDESRMPFTLAFLKEVLRWKTVLPFSLTRRSTEDATIMGHFIPKNTLVLSNIWAVHHDPRLWDDPFAFNPYRFLLDCGKVLIDPEGYMPFSLGKRSCVAEQFVRKWLFLYFVVILQKFKISSPNGQDAFEEEFHITTRPKKDVKLTFELRSSLSS